MILHTTTIGTASKVLITDSNFTVAPVVANLIFSFLLIIFAIILYLTSIQMQKNSYLPIVLLCLYMIVSLFSFIGGMIYITDNYGQNLCLTTGLLMGFLLTTCFVLVWTLLLHIRLIRHMNLNGVSIGPSKTSSETFLNSFHQEITILLWQTCFLTLFFFVYTISTAVSTTLLNRTNMDMINIFSVAASIVVSCVLILIICELAYILLLILPNLQRNMEEKRQADNSSSNQVEEKKDV